MVELDRLRDGDISIQMYPNDYPPPHFHAVKDNTSAKIYIRTMEVKKSSLTRKQRITSH